MLKVKINDNEAIPIPAKVAKKLALKDGAIIEARVEKGKLLILSKKKTKLQKSCNMQGCGKTKMLTRYFVKSAGNGENGKNGCLHRHGYMCRFPQEKSPWLYSSSKTS